MDAANNVEGTEDEEAAKLRIEKSRTLQAKMGKQARDRQARLPGAMREKIAAQLEASSRNGLEHYVWVRDQAVSSENAELRNACWKYCLWMDNLCFVKRTGKENIDVIAEGYVEEWNVVSQDRKRNARRLEEYADGLAEKAEERLSVVKKKKEKRKEKEGEGEQ